MKKTQKIISMLLAVMLLFSCVQALPVSAAEVGAEEAGALPPTHFLFADSLNWGQVYMYAWNDGGSELTAEWPGDPISTYEENEYDQTVYSVDVPEGAYGIILSNGYNEQTDNIINFNPGGGGYYLDPDKTETNELGATVFIAIPFDKPVPTEPTTEPTVKPTQKSDPVKFLFADSLNWRRVYMYAYNEEGDVGSAWPGEELSSYDVNEYGETEYIVRVPEGATGVIINNGKGENTDSITRFNPGGGGYYLDSRITTVNEYGATVFVPIPLNEPATNAATEPETEPTTAPAPEPATKPAENTSTDPDCPPLSFRNTLNWENVFVYAWDSLGNNLSAAWPGDQQSNYQIVNGEQLFYINVPDGAAGIIINNGFDQQAGEIKDFAPNGGGYYLDPDKTKVNELGLTVFIPVPFDGSVPTEPETEPTTAPATEPETEPETEPIPAIEPASSTTQSPCALFKISNGLNWEQMYMFAWDNEGNNLTAEWPGNLLSAPFPNEFSRPPYDIYVPEGAAGVILNDGKNNQTIDITDFFPAGGGYYLDPSMTTVNELGTTVYIPITMDRPVIVPTEPETEPTTAPATEPETEPETEPIPAIEPASSSEEPGAMLPYFWFYNYLSWEQVYMYAWDNDGSELTGAWPGKAIDSEINEKGERAYRVCVPDGAAGVILNNGNGKQTADITDFDPSGGGYYLHPYKTTVTDYGTTVYVPVPKDSPAFTYILGDADCNDTVNINDVTAIQKYLAKAPLDLFDDEAADVDRNWTVNINDATLIQYYLAGMENKNSRCGEIRNYDERDTYHIYDCRIDFTDVLDWGNVSVIARDRKGNILKKSQLEKSYYGHYTLDIPYVAASFVVISEDGTKQTEPFKDIFMIDGTYYVAWDKQNEKYVLEYEIWGGLIPEFEFINSLGWKNVCVTSYDKYGNVIDDFVAKPANSPKYTIDVSFTADKVILSNGEGEETDCITQFYGSPGNEEVYYLSKAETTVNWFGKTVYVPLRYPFGEYPNGPAFYFTNSLGWDDLHIYAWDEFGELTSSWPGDKLTEYKINSKGEEVYVVNVPFRSIGVIISGAGGQTDTITDFTPGGGGYYLDPDKTTVNEWGTTVFVPQEGGENPNLATFYFKNSLGWTDLHIYAWDYFGNEFSAAWPGDKLTYFEINEYGQEVYAVTVPANATGVVISGNGGQTDNIYDFTPGGGGYYLDPNKTTVNDFSAIVYVPVPWDEKPDETSFYFSNSLNWTDLHVYAWDENGYNLTADWPGDKLTVFDLNDYGQEVYTVTVPMDAMGVIISGDEGQTESIYDLNPGGGGYFLVPNKTTVNEFGATVYLLQGWW